MAGGGLLVARQLKPSAVVGIGNWNQGTKVGNACTVFTHVTDIGLRT